MTQSWRLVIIKVSGHQYRWLAGGYDLENMTFLEVASMVVTWWIVGFFALCLFHPVHALIPHYGCSLDENKPVYQEVNFPHYCFDFLQQLLSSLQTHYKHNSCTIYSSEME